MRPLIFACLALFALPLAARCQNGTGILMEPGLVLRADPPRQLTLNAHVPQFLYQPGGDSLAYVSVHDANGARTTAVKFVGAHNKDPDTRTLYTVTGDIPDASVPAILVPSLYLLDWSSDGRYLMFKQGDSGRGPEQCFCVDIGSDSSQTTRFPSPQVPMDNSLIEFAWSPSSWRFLVVGEDFRPVANGVPPSSFAEIYDPSRDQVQPLTIPDGQSVWGWLDNDHLRLLHYAHGQKMTNFSYDIAAGTELEIAQPSVTNQAKVVFALPTSEATVPKSPGLMLETQPHTLMDAQGVAQTKAQTVWIRRARAPKAMSALAVGVTPSADDPQAQWSPEGDGVAFLAHGDLFVAALTKQEATPFEKLAAGEKLGCDEEKQIIMDNLKQIGLGIMQYTQDYDEKFPAGGGWHDAVYPYVKDESVFNFPGVPITYHPPANLSLAAMDDPAGTVIASADTPCAHIVLMADGHVKSFDKAGADAPSPP